MAKRKIKNACSDFNELLRTCNQSGMLCMAVDQKECPLRPSGVKKTITHVEPVVEIEYEPSKPVIRSNPTLAEQLWEFGTSASPLILSLDRTHLLLSLETVEPPIPGYRKIDQMRDVDVSEFDHGVEFRNLEPCDTCEGTRKWRYHISGKKSHWVCDRCHPSEITPDKTIYPPKDGIIGASLIYRYIPSIGYVSQTPLLTDKPIISDAEYEQLLRDGRVTRDTRGTMMLVKNIGLTLDEF